MTAAVLRLPDHVHFGPGSRASLLPAVEQFGRRVLMICDPFLVTTSGFRQIVAALEGRGCTVTVFDDVVPELPVSSIEIAAEVARLADPDVVVAFGGGSAIDLAKVVALLVRHPGPLSLYYGENAVPGPVLPIIAMPTTAGTGSEVTPVAVVSDPSRELKVGISDPALIPRYAIVDPELSAGAPSGVTAYAGIDALVHAMESLTSARRPPQWDERLPVFVGSSPLTSLFALEAIRAIGGALPRAVQTEDPAARERMAWGSMLAGMAFGSAGTHLSHAIQYPVGAATKTPHGLGTGMLLPYVLQATRAAAIEPLAQAAHALGVEGASADQSAQNAIERVAEIAETIGIPRTLAEIGITRTQLPRISKLALGVTRLAGNSPVPPTKDLVDHILEAALTGDREGLG